MSSPAQYIQQLRESNQALAEGMVKYAETIVALRRELAHAGGANTLDVMDRAYFAGKDAGIAEAEAVAAARSKQEVGVCCGDYDKCWKACTPRGRWLAEKELSKPEQEPLGYLCENAAGFKYFRHKKPDKVYKPIALYAAAPPRERVEVTEPDAGALHPKYHYHPTWAIYDAIREGSMSAEQFRHWCNWTAEETLAMVRGAESFPSFPSFPSRSRVPRNDEQGGENGGN